MRSSASPLVRMLYPTPSFHFHPQILLLPALGHTAPFDLPCPAAQT